MGTGRLGVIYIPSAAQPSGRKEPRGRKAPLHLSLLLAVSITPEQGDAGVRAASALEVALPQWGFPQKTGSAPSEGWAEQESKEDALLGLAGQRSQV